MNRNEIFKALGDVKKVLEETHKYKVFVIVLQGSQNYNLDEYSERYQSDIDMKAFILPTFEDVYKGEKVSKVLPTAYGQVEVKDVRLLSELLGKANPSYLELLASEYFIAEDKFTWVKIRSLLHELVSDRKPLLVKGIYGMMKEKEAALSKLYPSTQAAVEKYGYDPKQYHHIYRLQLLMADVLNNKNFAEALFHQDGPRRTDLMNLKIVPVDLDIVQAHVLIMVDHVKQMKEDFEETNPLILSTSLYAVRELEMELVRDGLTRELEKKNMTRTVQGYKCPFDSLPADAKEVIAQDYPDIDDTYMVDIHKYSQWIMYNYWKK